LDCYLKELDDHGYRRSRSSLWRHIGVTVYSFVAPASALLPLAASLERLAPAPIGARFEEHASARGNPDALTALAFSACTPDQLAQLQSQCRRLRLRRAASASFYLAGAFLAVIGAVSVTQGVIAWLKTASLPKFYRVLN
jgi:hypothetical protein